MRQTGYGNYSTSCEVLLGRGNMLLPWNLAITQKQKRSIWFPKRRNPTYSASKILLRSSLHPSQQSGLYFQPPPPTVRTLYSDHSVWGQLKCDGTRAETRFRLSAKRTSPFKSAVASVQSTTGSRGVRISGSNAGYTMFRGSVKGTGYPLHSTVSPSLSLPCVTVCHHISTGVCVPHNSQN